MSAPNLRQIELTETRTGLRIGRSFVRPAPRELGSEAERIQAALLQPPPRPPLLARVLGGIFNSQG